VPPNSPATIQSTRHAPTGHLHPTRGRSPQFALPPELPHVAPSNPNRSHTPRSVQTPAPSAPTMYAATQSAAASARVSPKTYTQDANIPAAYLRCTLRKFLSLSLRLATRFKQPVHNAVKPLARLFARLRLRSTRHQSPACTSSE